MRLDVLRAVGVFREHTKADDATVTAALIRLDFSPTLARRLVEFMPTAFCFALLHGTGVRFKSTYRRVDPNGRLGPQRALSDEPEFVAALEVARSGLNKDDILAVAGRSAEFHGINTLLNNGSKLSNLALTESVFLHADETEEAKPSRQSSWPSWLTTGKDDMKAEVQRHTSKSWWQFWK